MVKQKRFIPPEGGSKGLEALADRLLFSCIGA